MWIIITLWFLVNVDDLFIFLLNVCITHTHLLPLFENWVFLFLYLVAGIFLIFSFYKFFVRYMHGNYVLLIFSITFTEKKMRVLELCFFLIWETQGFRKFLLSFSHRGITKICIPEADRFIFVVVVFIFFN